MMKSQVILLFILAIGLKLETASSQYFASHRPKPRLPQNVVPKTYIMEFEPNGVEEKFKFSGSGEYHIEVVQPTATITLHKAEDLKVKNHSITLISEDGKTHLPSDLQWDKSTDFYEIKFSSELEPDHYVLKMDWEGRDGADTWHSPRIGFFSSVQPKKDKDSSPSVLLTTRFKPDKARMAFPCWDEPGFKARFILSIKHPSKYSAISNMPAEKVEKWVNDKDLTVFKRSPKMSPHSLAWTISDYKKDGGFKDIHFDYSENQLNSTKFPLKISELVVMAMEKYTQFNYPLPKLDQVVISEFRGEASENWGLISYAADKVLLNESMLLVDVKQQDAITFLVAKEIAHQWFGNLVSPNYWNDAWLSESFAQYFAYKMIDSVYSNRGVMDEFGVEFVEDAFSSDFHLPFPIKQVPKQDDDLEFYIFNPATHKKGAGVLRMLEFLLTNKVFRKGIRRYLKQHQYTGVVTEDLWNNLQAAYDESTVPFHRLNIKEFMEPWIKLYGFPEVEVHRKSNGTIVVKQMKHSIYSRGSKWMIPITYVTKSSQDRYNADKPIWLYPSNDSVSINFVDSRDWIIVNVQQRGFYKVQYSSENWKKLIDHLHKDRLDAIHPVNRAQLIFTAHHEYFLSSDYLDRIVNLTSYLHRERNYLPWIPACGVMKKLKEDLDNTPMEKTFYRHMLFIMDNILKDVGFEPKNFDDYKTIKARNILTPYACMFGHPECHKRAHQLFNKYLENPSPNAFSNADWNWVLCYGLQESNDDAWDKLIAGQLLLPEDIDKKRLTYVKCAKTPEKKQKYFTQALSSSSINRTFYVTDAIEALLEDSQDNVDFIINYIVESYETLKKYFTDRDDSYSATSILIGLKYKTKRREQIDKLKRFLEPMMNDLKKDDKYDFFGGTFETMEETLNRYQDRSTRYREILDSLNLFMENNKTETAGKA